MATECANPLLLQWLGEWLANARERSSKGITTYKKAYDSMKACPMRFEHPSEAKVLQGLGDKLCARLTDKLTQHCQENNIPMPAMPHKRKKSRKAPTGGDDEGEEDNEDAPAPKRARKKKPYVPKLGSGAYAIMLALSTVYEENPSGITKDEVIKLAEPHCEHSFTLTNPGAGKFYSAWNSMKTLQNHDYVLEKKGSAKRYGLTDEGWETVKMMKSTLEPGQQTLGGSSKHKSAGALSTRYDDDDDDSMDNESEPAPRASRNPFLRDNDGFQELNPLGIMTSKPRNQKTTASESRAPTNPVARDYEGDEDLDALEPPNPPRSRNPYLRNDDNFQDMGTAMSTMDKSRGNKTATSKPRGQSIPPPRGDSFQETYRATISRSAVSGAAQSLRDHDGFHESGSRQREDGSAMRRATSPDDPGEIAGVIPRGDPSDKTSIPKFTTVVLPASAFTVQLVLDVREIQSKSKRDHFEDELRKLGVKPIMRALPLGDTLWVAKCNDPTFLAQFGVEGDEIMLDHIVERKRKDDLVTSIKDRRYDEQKFRLKKSGVKNITYIIEEINLTHEHLDGYEKAVESAIASMQVVYGFFVKRTLTTDDTIRHLAKMTGLLKKVYEGKSLNIIPSTVLTTDNYPRLRKHLAETEPSTDYYITYGAFAGISSKSDTLTLRDIFLKMLMCTKGITSEKAMEIQRRWKTPYALYQAFKELGEGKEADKRKQEFLTKSLSNAVARKNISRPASMRLAAVWGDVKET